MTVDEWDYREVCQDGACTGVIGPDGRCKACGRVSPAWNNERERGLVEAAPGDSDEPGDEADAELGAEADQPDERDAALAPEASTDDHEWSRRVLCSDGACVGVIGPTGFCTVCGKPPA
ncbi:hypothetical protein BH11MYX1_BH11MYX1_56780 [soil metagenome]